MTMGTCHLHTHPWPCQGPAAAMKPWFSSLPLSFLSPTLSPLASASHHHSLMFVDLPSSSLLTQESLGCLLAIKTSGPQLSSPNIPLLAPRLCDFSSQGAQDTQTPWVCHLPESLSFPISHLCNTHEFPIAAFLQGGFSKLSILPLSCLS